MQLVLWVECSQVLQHSLLWVQLLLSQLLQPLQQQVLLLHSLQLSQQLLQQVEALMIFHSKLNNSIRKQLRVCHLLMDDTPSFFVSFPFLTEHFF